MIVLDTSTRSLQIVLAGAKNTNDAPFVASYVDEPVTSTALKAAQSSNPSNTNGVTAVTVMAASGLAPGWRRRLISFNLNNADLAAITLSILYNDNGTTYALYKITLQTLEQLTYEEGFGFNAYTADGALKSQAVATSSATSLALASASQASLSVSVLWSMLPASVSSQASSVAQLNPHTVSSLQSLASVQSFTAGNFASVSAAASGAVIVSSIQSVTSVASFTGTTWSTASSAVSRLKASFTW